MAESYIERATALLPLTEATLYILLALSRPRHGYAILQTAEVMSEGKVTLGPGTLYGALGRLVKQGLAERIEDESSSDDRRKLYQLTKLGVVVVRMEVDRLKVLVRYGEEALREVVSRGEDGGLG